MHFICDSIEKWASKVIVVSTVIRFYNTENWKAYGYIEVRLFKIFDFFEGIKIAEEKFNAPRKVRVQQDK